MVKNIKERLQSLGYEFKVGDDVSLNFCIEKVTNTIKNECNISEVPEGLLNVAVDMVVGEFLKMKKTFSPADLTNLDLSVAVKQIQTGDTNTVFAIGESTLTPEQRLDSVINYFLNYGRAEFSAYRKIKW